jgi:hypothetical protein
MTTVSKILKEAQDFESREIQIVPGLVFNQRKCILTTYFHYNSKFETGDIDDEGDRKYFYNININPCKVCSKAIDFDTKNIRLLTAGGGNPLKTWFMERDVKYWMRDKQFGKVLNRIFHDLPIFGSVVIKIIDGTPYFVDLRNFIVEQSADDLDSSNYIIEVHYLTVADFRKKAKLMKWSQSKVDEVIEKFREMKSSHITLYERYGEVEMDGKNREWKYQRTFIADVGADEFKDIGDQRIQLSERGVELSSEDWDEHPYWEFHLEKMPGRWLGIGVVETLREPQIHANMTCNLESKTAYWEALRAFQIRDETFNRNLATDVRNGEVLNVGSEVTLINTSGNSGAFFNQQGQKWMQNRAELTFSYDVVQGERLPAGTPLGSAQLATAQTLSYFEGIQENIAMDIKEMLYEVIIPQFIKENNKEHTIRLVGKDLDAYIAMTSNFNTFQEVVRLAVEKNKFVTQQEADVISVVIGETIKSGKEKILPVPKGFYDGIKYDIDIDITGESVDTRIRAAAKFAVIQAITADPTMTTDPFKKKILMSYMEDGGINPNDFFDVESKKPDELVQQPQGRAGGGVSAPELGGSPMRGQQVTTM